MNPKSSLLYHLSGYLGRNGSRGLSSVKNIFRALYFRTAWYSDDHVELERIFKTLKDPWNFETSPYEQERLKLLLGVVGSSSPRSILEVGCAEGVFSSMLSTLTDRVVGIDVSQTAVERARERCPGLEFVTTSLEAFNPPEKFDVVVCAETLYYIQDVREAINKLSTLGRRCVVSYIQRESGRLDAEVGRIPGVEIRKYNIGSTILGRGMVAATWEA